MPTIAVLSMKGGVGKSTITLGLASVAWERGHRALIVDLDPQANATMGLDVLAPVFTTNDVLADARPGVAVDAVTGTGWAPHIKVIAAERALEHRNINEGRHSALRLRASLASLPRSYDLVVIDCPPSLGELTRNALSAADLAVVVTEPGYFALHGAAQALEAVEIIRGTTNPGLRVATIVINRARPHLAEQRVRINELREAYGSLVSPTVLPERTSVPQAQGAGIPIHAWHSPGAREISELFEDIYDEILPAVNINARNG